MGSMFGGGGGGQPTSQTTTQVTAPPDYVIGPAMEYLERAQELADTPYSTYEGVRVAPLNAVHQAALGQGRQAMSTLLPLGAATLADFMGAPGGGQVAMPDMTSIGGSKPGNMPTVPPAPTPVRVPTRRPNTRPARRPDTQQEPQAPSGSMWARGGNAGPHPGAWDVNNLVPHQRWAQALNLDYATPESANRQVAMGGRVYNMNDRPSWDEYYRMIGNQERLVGSL